MKKLYLDHTRKAVLIFLIISGLLATVLTAHSATYYSRATGNWNGAIWSTSATGGTVGTATITSSDNVIIQVNHTVTFNVANATINNLQINNGSGTGTSTIAFVNDCSLVINNLSFAGGGNRSGSIDMTNGGKLTIQGTVSDNKAKNTFIAGSGTVEYSGTTQTVFALFLGNPAYNNLTLSGSDEKTITGVTVNGILSMEGTTSVNVAPTYGTNATLQYNRTSDLTISSPGSPEWISSFTGTGGIVIKNTGVITLAKPVTTLKLTVEPGAKFSNALGNTLINNGTIIINSDALNNSGSLINYGTVGGTGTVTYNRWLQATNYQLISSPVNPTGWNNPDNIYSFIEYDEATDIWSTPVSVPTTLTNGRGYGMVANTAGIVTFTGTLNTDVDITLSFSEDANYYYGWNLIGNPYTSAIAINDAANSVNNFLKSNVADNDEGAIDDSYRAVYVYDGATDTYKCIGNTGFGAPGGEGLLNQDFVQAGQGFFVKSNNRLDDNEIRIPSVIKFNTSMQAHYTDISLKSAEKSWPGVQLKVNSLEGVHSTIVTYHSEMTLGLDPSYDAGLFSSGGEIELYTRLVKDNGVNFMIQAVPDYDFEQNAVPVGVNFAKGGEVTFSGYVVPLDGNYKIYLEDRLTGVLTDLSQDEYTVTLSANTKGTGRFFVVAAQTTGIETPGEISDNLMIWASDRKIHIRGELSGKATARLLDLNGRLIMETSLPDTRNNLVQAPVRTGGIYLLQVLDGNRHTTRKVVIN